MDSISGACLRLSWFISNSYSKSEIARSPLMIAVAPRSRANSTSSVLNGSTEMLGSVLVALRRNATRSSALNSVAPLRHGRLTTATTTSSNIPEARLITSRCPHVTGSNVPGQRAMRLVGVMDLNQGVAVTALVEQGQLEAERLTPVGLGDDTGSRGERPGQCRRQLGAERAAVAIWRV